MKREGKEKGRFYVVSAAEGQKEEGKREGKQSGVLTYEGLCLSRFMHSIRGGSQFIAAVIVCLSIHLCETRREKRGERREREKEEAA